MANKKKVFFIIYSIAHGGAERVFSIVLNNIDKSKFDVVLIKICNYDVEYKIKNDVRVVSLSQTRTLFAIPAIIKMLINEKPDIVCTTIAQVNILIGFISPLVKLIVPKCKFVMRETTIPSVNNKMSKIPEWILTLLVRYIYPNFDVIIAQGVKMKKDLVDVFNIDPQKITIISNPIEESNIEIGELSRQSKPPFTLITVGNLTKIKGYDRLLKIIYELKKEIDFKYFILGAGQEKDNMLKTIQDLKIEENCMLVGNVSNVSDYLAKADLFLQGSYYEGFPNVLLEANQVGLPVVAFDVPGGTSEIVEDGFNGFLVADGDVSAYVSKVTFALTYQFDKKQIATNIRSRFSKSKTISEYENSFLSNKK